MSAVRGNNNNVLITLPPYPTQTYGHAGGLTIYYQLNEPGAPILPGFDISTNVSTIIDSAQGYPFIFDPNKSYSIYLNYYPNQVPGQQQVPDHTIIIQVPAISDCFLQVNSIFSAGAAVIADVTTHTINPTNLTMSITNPTNGAISSSPYNGQNPFYPPGSLFYYSGVMMPVPSGQNQMFIFCYDAGYNLTPNVNLTLDGCSTVVTPIDYNTITNITNLQDPIYSYIANTPPVEAKPLGYRKSGYTSSSSDNSTLYMILIFIILFMILSRKKR